MSVRERRSPAQQDAGTSGAALTNPTNPAPALPDVAHGANESNTSDQSNGSRGASGANTVHGARRKSAMTPSHAASGNGHTANGAAPGARRPAARSAPPAPSRASGDALAQLASIRAEVCERFRPEVNAGAAPIRVMARMVREVERVALERGITREAVSAGVVNRTIGDVDLRRVSPTEDGPEFVSLADDIGIALPGEIIGGRVSAGATYRLLHERMLEIERALLARDFDLRMYDINGTGNPILRELLAAYEHEHFGLTLDPQRIYLSLGSLDGLDKFWRGYAFALRQRGLADIAVVFPAPSFNVPEWQAVSLGFRLHRLQTLPEDHFKVTPPMLAQALDEAPDIRAFYLTVSNNPTAFAYSYDELRALFDVVERSRPDVVVVADLAYIGTGAPADDRRRMAAFADSGILPRTVLAHSFSKTHTLTGDRCGWVAFGDPTLATAVGPGWTNSTASLPADWQLHYTASVQLFNERPDLVERIRALYRHRRARLVQQLRHIDERQHLFARVNLDDGGTVYNWSQLRPGQDVFSLFVHTGIAGVPGGGFGYSDDFVRFSIGCVPVPDIASR
jgi:aspartate/methionine/tyrosine aminotransferase